MAVVVAHPDDETIGCGALLSRLAGADLVVVTDGAPRNLVDACACGYGSASDYAAERKRELFAALEIGGIRPAAVTMLGCADQQAARRLIPLSQEIADFLRSRDIDVVLTHAYEGGHPDHDATAFAVHAAAALALREGQDIRVIEMPFYRLGSAGMSRQSFGCGGPRPVRLTLDREAQARKRHMIEAHATQHATLASFHVAAELFRTSPKYDFAALPNGGRILYDAYDWGLSAAEWLCLVGVALEDMELAHRQ